MPIYEVSSTHYFRENGQKVEAGGTIELTEEQAAANNAAHPGLLKPMRLTTQKQPDTIRTEVATPDKTRRRKTRIHR